MNAIVSNRLKQRVVAPEWLDTLATDDPRAIRSRGDLRRINRMMASCRLLAQSLEHMLGEAPSPRLVELGAGDGSLAMRLARRLAPRWPNATLCLLDLQPSISHATLGSIEALGWRVEVIGADVLAWLADEQAHDQGKHAPILFANLFVHHFEGVRLQALLDGIAGRARGFVCVEPRRSATALLGSQLVGAMGCNDVTRHDAVVSVRAGFTGNELSEKWCGGGDWQLRESAAGLFSHRLEAARLCAPGLSSRGSQT